MRAINVGGTDTAIRWLLTIGLSFLSIITSTHMVLSLVLAMFALGMAASALTHYCPLYTWLGISTRRTPRPPLHRW
jgi:hypothetical protein